LQIALHAKVARISSLEWSISYSAMFKLSAWQKQIYVFAIFSKWLFCIYCVFAYDGSTVPVAFY